MTKTKEKKLLWFGLLAIGVLAIIFAIISWCSAPEVAGGIKDSFSVYGADFYTDMQNATVAAANNIYYLNGYVEELGEFFASCIGYFLFIIGLVLSLVSLVKIFPRTSHYEEECDYGF